MERVIIIERLMTEVSTLLSIVVSLRDYEYLTTFDNKWKMKNFLATINSEEELLKEKTKMIKTMKEYTEKHGTIVLHVENKTPHCRNMICLKLMISNREIDIKLSSKEFVLKRCNHCLKSNLSSSIETPNGLVFKTMKLKRCSRCKNMYYCSKECQIADWESHKFECKNI